MRRSYDEVKVIMECKICPAVFRPERGEQGHHGFCYKHRSLYWKSWYAKYLKGKNRSKYKVAQDRAWDNWVEQNKKRRRAQALKSYHKNKKFKN